MLQNSSGRFKAIHFLRRHLFRVRAHDEMDLVRAAIDLFEQPLQINRAAGARGCDDKFHAPNQPQLARAL